MIMNIEYRVNKYAPEQSVFWVNGEVFAKGSQLAHDLGYMVACGQKKEAEDRIKREYRKQFKKRRRCTIGFYKEGSNQYFYTSQLGAYDDDLLDKLRVYKEWKRYCKSLNGVVSTHEIAEGEFVPGQKSEAKVTYSEDRVDFSRPLKLYFR